MERLSLFEAGDGAYAIYRIPGIVVTPTGTLLVCCEARRSARGDWGAIDLLLRRSRPPYGCTSRIVAPTPRAPFRGAEGGQRGWWPHLGAAAAYEPLA